MASETDEAIGCVVVGAGLAFVSVIALAWFVVLPVIGILYLVGGLK